ncbi:hypothetical protein AVEN_102422-1 [Araneus ventricosus]|uniref:Uncharacterized protein n=1 Tax=Araneus ventricosus TaxID=182803 RepID=A0A4Y2FLG7_ARAVE|nr:hypothetical protein AVEN_102422-1 [Araneus ventricosus]
MHLWAIKKHAETDPTLHPSSSLPGMRPTPHSLSPSSGRGLYHQEWIFWLHNQVQLNIVWPIVSNNQARRWRPISGRALRKTPHRCVCDEDVCTGQWSERYQPRTWQDTGYLSTNYVSGKGISPDMTDFFTCYRIKNYPKSIIGL